MRGGSKVDGSRIMRGIAAYKYLKDKFLLFFLFLVVLAFILPTYVHPIPYGTDVYTHLFFTREMMNMNSLYRFYENCLEEGYLSYDYPFGLWLFGSIVGKITCLDMLGLARVLPFAIMVILMTLYCLYANIFGKSADFIALSLIFLLSIPIICIGILEYSPSVFTESFLVFVLLLLLFDKISLWKQVFLINIFMFVLCFTHTGTYMFLFSLTHVYLFLYLILHGDLHKNTYLTTTSSIFIYIITLRVFPYVHPQYVDKGIFLVSVGNFLTSDLHIPLASKLGQMFYEHIFVNLDFLYAAYWCALIYTACMFLTFLRQKIRFKALSKRINTKTFGRLFSVPIVGNIRRVSHSIMYTPFWLGPIHVTFATLGAFKTNKKGLCILLSVSIVTLLPGYIRGEGGTGALREIEYFFIIIPILAALGFCYVKEKIEGRIGGILHNFFTGMLLLGVFSLILIMPVVGNLYYHPLISGSNHERMGLQWLSNIGSPKEGCAGWGYRHMISLYANKIPPSVTTISTGSEMRRYIHDLYNACFKTNSEEYADDLYATFGVRYLIISERTLHNMGETYKQLRIDYNVRLDKIYSSAELFSVYKYITPVVHRINTTQQLNFVDKAMVEDAGDSYLVRTKEYKVRISKTSPEIMYIGNKTSNFLGDSGMYYEYIRITWSNKSHVSQANSYVLHKISFPIVMLGDNQIIYSAILKNQNATENWATLTVKYTFFQKAMKREIIVSNDWMQDSSMKVYVSMTYFSPMRYFQFSIGEHTISRIIYPSEDEVQLKKIRFNKMFINNGDEGVYMEFDNTAPYPSEISYAGLVEHPYYTVSMRIQDTLLPSESMHITQWLSLGDKQTAICNVERYTSVSLYPYANGTPPVALINDVGSLNVSEEDFKPILNTHKKLKELDVANYTSVVRLGDTEINASKMNQLLELGTYVIGCCELGHNTTQKIDMMKKNALRYNTDLKGVMPENLIYGLNTVKALTEQDIMFMLSKKVLPAFDIYYQEGLRRPKMAYYQGEKTSLVLLPISMPTLPGATYFYDSYEEAWRAVIDSVMDNDDVCIFLWDAKKVNDSEYMEQVANAVAYAKMRGMKFTTPYEIARHFKLLQKVSAIVSISDDWSRISIKVNNGNEVPIEGITFRVELPGAYEYSVEGGMVSREEYSATKRIYYISTNLTPKETKEIILEKI